MRPEHQGIDSPKCFSECCGCGEVRESTGMLMCDSVGCHNVLFEDHECDIVVMCECGNFYFKNHFIEKEYYLKRRDL